VRLTHELTAQALVVLRVGYFGGLIGVFAFLALWEDGNPLTAGSSPARSSGAFPAPGSARARHMARNVGLAAAAAAFVYALVLNWQSPEIATFPGFPAGLLERFGVPFAALLAIGLIITDLAEYLFHRLCHRWRWLWLMHAVHHSDPELDVTTSLRFHPFEPALEAILKMALLLLLGIPLWMEAVRALVLNPVNLFQHASVAYPRWVERHLQWLIVTPAMHRLHHSPVMAETNSNFGPGLSVWDRLFGTFRRPDADRPLNYGLSKLSDDSWQSVGGMLLTPFTARHLGTL
jgi:sterol desaturase/sphingolipid hydroxylase (fatty acid hydroxylase superfamily)